MWMKSQLSGSAAPCPTCRAASGECERAPEASRNEWQPKLRRGACVFACLMASESGLLQRALLEGYLSRPLLAPPSGCRTRHPARFELLFASSCMGRIPVLVLHRLNESSVVSGARTVSNLSPDGPQLATKSGSRGCRWLRTLLFQGFQEPGWVWRSFCTSRRAENPHEKSDTYRLRSFW